MALKKRCHAVDPKYQRSDGYRRTYLRSHKGILGKYYICHYCGRIMSREYMEVDHVISVDAAKKSRVARGLLPRGVNDVSNLVSACSKCNNRKSNKGGLWIIRGYIGSWLQPLIWAALCVFFVWFIVWFFRNDITPDKAQQIIYSISRNMAEFVGEIITFFLHNVIVLVREITHWEV